MYYIIPGNITGLNSYEIYVSGTILEKEAFVTIRKKLSRTQKQLAELLGVSLKAIHSYEQGWRKIPLHIERQLWFLIYQKKNKKAKKAQPCWERKSCDLKDECPAWEFRCGDMCWFVSGTKCDCTKNIDVRDKMEICRKCTILKTLLR
jgi:DNA-binding transcriptional regulator YiaG